MRHLPFLKALAKANDAGDPVWRDAAPGYLVLRFFDRWLEDGPAAMSADPALPALKGRIRSVGVVAPPVRRTLLNFVDALVDAPDLNPAPAVEHLFEYGDYLRSVGHIGLARHIYSTVADVLDRAGEINDPRLGRACYHLGLTSLLLGEFEVARASYARAEALANGRNDLEQLFRAQCGLAKVFRAQGNLPASEKLLRETASRAVAAEMPVSESFVRHELGAVLSVRGQYDEAIHNLYRAYELLSGVERENVLSDLAGTEVMAGYREAARDVHRLLAYTAQLPEIRAASLINLIELAVLDDDEASYNRAQLDFIAFQQRHEIPVEHGIHAVFYIAMGVERFGRVEAAIEAYRNTITKAREAKIHQIEFEAEQKLNDLMERQRRPVPVVPVPSAVVPPVELHYITDTLAAAAASALATQGL